MSIIGRIKSLFLTKENEKIEKYTETSLSGINTKIKENQQEIGRKKHELDSLAVNKSKEFISVLKEKIKNLELIDLNKRKEDAKIKLIVRENLNFYISYLKKLVVDLEKAEEKDYIRRANQLFFMFERLAKPAFEKATFLIGEELGEVKNFVSSFIAEIIKLSQENQKQIDKESRLKELISNFEKIENLKKAALSAEKSINLIASQKKEAQVKLEKIKEEINNLKLSQEYALAVEEKLVEEQKIENQLSLIKNKINFKNLARLFHTIESKNKLIKEYQNNFRQSLLDDKNLEIIELAKSIELDISELRQLKQKIEAGKESKINEIIANSEEKARNLAISLEIMNNSENEEKKKISRFNEKISGLEKEIKEKYLNIVNDINISLVCR